MPSGFFGFGRSFAFTPDGAAIVAVSRSGVVEVDLVRGGWQMLAEGSAFTEVALSSDGRRIGVIEDMSGLTVIDRTTGLIRTFASLYRTRRDGAMVPIDFIMHPTFDHTGGKLYGVAWSHPRLPWDGTSLVAFEVGDEESKGIGATLLDESGGISLSQPQVVRDRLYVLSDVTGWMLPCQVATDSGRLDPLAWHGEPGDAAETDQGLGQRSWVIDDDAAYLSVNREGFGELVRLDLGDGTLQSIRRGVFGWISAAGGKVAAMRSGARVSPTIVCGSIDGAGLIALRTAHP
ncbi:MAG: hypothetical protein ACP5PJ_04155, partial [Acidimicrobiales bacterium]